MKRQHPIDEFFHRELEAHESKPSAAVWDSIQKEIPQQQKNKAWGIYLLRAASITLLLGMSTLFYFERNAEDLIPGEPIKNTPVGTTDRSEGEDKSASQEEEQSPGKKTESEEGKNEVSPEDKPKLVAPSVSRKQRFVDNTQLKDLPEINEAELWASEEEPLLSESLKVEDKPERYRIKVKLSPNTIKSFYADSGADNEAVDQAKPGFGDRLFAYANDQVNNLVNGRKLELPKTETKPQLSFNLPRIIK